MAVHVAVTTSAAGRGLPFVFQDGVFPAGGIVGGGRVSALVRTSGHPLRFATSGLRPDTPTARHPDCPRTETHGAGLHDVGADQNLGFGRGLGDL